MFIVLNWVVCPFILRDPDLSAELCTPRCGVPAAVNWLTSLQKEQLMLPGKSECFNTLHIPGWPTAYLQPISSRLFHTLTILQPPVSKYLSLGWSSRVPTSGLSWGCCCCVYSRGEGNCNLTWKVNIHNFHQIWGTVHSGISARWSFFHCIWVSWSQW